jgi:hypothetical protein
MPYTAPKRKTFIRTSEGASLYTEKKEGAKTRQASKGNIVYAPKQYISHEVSHFQFFTLPNGMAKLPAVKAPAAIKNNPESMLVSIMGN